MIDMEIIGIMKLPIDKLEPHPVLKRVFRETDGFASNLVQSTKKGNVYEILVRDMNGWYQILDGHRRVEALEVNGFKKIECKVCKCNDTEALLIGYELNLQHEKLSPIDEARVLNELKTRYEQENPNCSKHGGNKRGQTEKSFADYIYEKTGVSKFQVGRLLRINKLPQEILENTENRPSNENKIPLETADMLSRIDDEELQKKIYGLAVENELTHTEVSELVANHKQGKNIEEISNIAEWMPYFRKTISLVSELKSVLLNDKLLFSMADSRKEDVSRALKKLIIVAEKKVSELDSE